MNEANKDAAMQYLDRARKYLREGDFNAAMKAANKSNSMYANPDAQDILTKAQAGRSSSKSTQPTSPTPSASSTARAPNASTARRRESKPSGDQRKATAAQIKIANDILGKSDLYDRLGVSRDAEEKDIRRAFLKMSVKVHPDKNPAPRANEAFKAINSACDVLCDGQKRRIYDQTGEENPNAARQQANPFAGFRRGGFQQGDPAEELLRQMFGGGFQGPGGAHFTFNGRPFGQQRRRARQPQAEGQQQQADPMNNMFWIFVCIMAMSFMWGDSGSGPSYSMTASTTYSTKRFVFNRVEDDEKIFFYLKPDLSEKWESPQLRSVRHQIEESVQTQYWQRVYSSCRRGKSQSCLKYERYRNYMQKIHSSRRTG